MAQAFFVELVVIGAILYTAFQPELQWECFDATRGKDSAREIREYYIPDFSQWERPEKFKEEFEKLLRNLKKAEAARAGAQAGSI